LIVDFPEINDQVTVTVDRVCTDPGKPWN